ncbi:MAG TPA: MauE/DoxX family redox-associated membrane protein [Euzebyales bacterium]|nr:MauE/DoxX family redox-associated membrane protein [Euzebyales bacterium]
MAYVLVGCRVLLLLVFAASTLGKIRNRSAWAAFVRSLRDLRLLPERAVTAVAVAVAAGEAAAVLLLAAPATIPAALAVVGVLLAAFTVAIVATLRRGVQAPCRCFGAASLPLGRRHVLRNAMLLAVAGLTASALSAPSASASASAHPAGLAVAVAAGLVGGALLVFFDELVELFAGPTSSVGPLGKGSV